ncbi:gliding motility protein GldM [Tannerella serpentiformis]|nr:gliding motility protein GldM [Tannerella serpentiformis]
MINLMYLVFIAMMAMNDTSSEVLSGFELVEKSLRESAATAADRNRKTLEELEAANRVNPTKVGEWYKKGVEVKKQSDELFEYIQQLKLRIIRQADGKDANVDQLQHKEDLDAASEIMLSPMGSEAAKLKKRLEAYRAAMSRMVDDPEKRTMLERAIDTKVPGKSGLNLRSWETALFENMPMASAVTILTKYQNDIRYVEGEALASIARSVDVGDYRVNKIVAQVVPKSQIVMSGTPYEAAIVLSAIDSTQRPQLFIGPRGSEREVVGYDGTYTVGTGSTGTFPVQGYLKVPGKDPYYFSSEYSVSAKTATVASALMRVLYAGRVRENEIEIAVPGVASGDVTATMTNGQIRTENGKRYAVPNMGAREAVISVSAKIGGVSAKIGDFTFKVRQLPKAQPYILYKDANGTTRKFTGGRISKRALLDAVGLQSAIDDGILDIECRVKQFTLTYSDSMGNSLMEVSQGGSFTERQKNYIRNLQRGKQFYIKSVSVTPEGVEQEPIVFDVIVQ